MTTYKVGIIIGSLSKSSINRLLARALMRVAPPELEFSEIAIKDLPFYSTDYEPNYPQAVHEFKEALSKWMQYCSLPLSTIAPFQRH